LLCIETLYIFVSLNNQQNNKGMKNQIRKNIGLVFLGWLIIAMLTLTLGSCSSHSKGYNYKAHSAKNAKFKKNNENGNYMKCRRH